MGRVLPGLVPLTASAEGSPSSLLSSPAGSLASLPASEEPVLSVFDSGVEAVEEPLSPPQAANTVATA